MRRPAKNIVEPKQEQVNESQFDDFDDVVDAEEYEPSRDDLRFNELLERLNRENDKMAFVLIAAMKKDNDELLVERIMAPVVNAIRNELVRTKKLTRILDIVDTYTNKNTNTRRLTNLSKSIE